jgi:hypothetical protein
VKKLRISIVLYNNPITMLQKVIRSALNTSLDITIHLIDNSPNDTLQTLTSMDDRINYFHNPTNLGFGTAHNLAIKESILKECPYHLVLNPDVYFEADILKKIVDYMDAHTEVGLLMPKVLYPNGNIQYVAKLLPTPWDLFARRFIPLKSYLQKLNRRYALTFFNYSSTAQIPFISGCFMFLRTSTLRKVGIFDEQFFMYLEDADLSRRIGIIAKTVLYPHVHIYHEYERGAHKDLRLLWIFIGSTVKYFNKYGWFFDPYRQKINQRTLEQLGWEKL